MAPPRYPVLVDLAGRPCLVVGGGAVAARKVQGLLDVGALVTVAAPDLHPSLASAASAGRVRWVPERMEAHGPLPAAPDAERWAFVVAATDDRAANRSVVARASAAGSWANDATAADGGPAALPAIHRDGPLTVAVSTAGVSPTAAAWARDRVAEALGPELGTALALADEVASGAGGGRRVDWRAAVDSGMLDLVRHGRLAEAKERLQACLSSSSE